jgi:undecaprenyl-diphosphatase
MGVTTIDDPGETVTFFEAVLLGLIQGLTEFVPISSTAHLTLAGKILGLVDPGNPAAWTEFIAVIQLGTLVAVVTYFAQDLISIARSVIRGSARPRAEGVESLNTRRLGLAVVVGTIPVFVAGGLLSNAIHGSFTKSTVVIISSLVVSWLPSSGLRRESPATFGCSKTSALSMH